MKIGLVGVGKWGKTVARKFTDQGHVIACHNRQAGDMVEGFGELIPWKQMQGKVDAIVAMAPPPVVSDVAFFCVENKIPVLVTKPLFDGEDIMSKWNNSIFMVDYVHLHSPLFQKMKMHVAAKEKTGIFIESIDAQFYGHGPMRNFPALYDYGPHALALIFNLASTCMFEVKTAKKTSSRPGREFYNVTADVLSIKVRMALGNDVPDNDGRKILVRFKDDTWATYGEERVSPDKGGWPLGFFETSEYAKEQTMADPLGLLVMKFCNAVRACEDGTDTDLEISSDVEYALSTILRAGASNP